jgi:CubicO group peptidase (beta-lactamase class C family)
MPLAAALLLLATGCAGPAGYPPPSAPAIYTAAEFAPIEQTVRQEIAVAHIPGAVIVIGTREGDIYRGAWGNAVLGAAQRPLTQDAIFDLASLTKPVATATAVMHLSDEGRIDIDAPAARYWPEFGANGKEVITIRELLTHYSGLPADLDLSREWRGYDTAMAMIVAQTPHAPPGTRYLYSDINFETLGEVVRRISGIPLDRYCRDTIFKPLGMTDTGYLPDPSLHERIAPTEDTKGHVHWSDVHDATARWMGGVAGHAGVFSTADDLAAFARMMLSGGSWNGARVLRPETVTRMTSVQSPAGGHTRGLGWDLGGPDGDVYFPPGSYGHLGFTGTMLWIDPGADLFAVVLTHRVYPDGTGDAGPLRRAVLALLSDAIVRHGKAPPATPPS